MAEVTNPYEIFQTRIADYQSQNQQLAKLDKKYSLARLALFLIVAGVLYFAFLSSQLLVGLVVVLVFILIFGLIVNKHQRLRFEKEILAIKVAINTQELKRLDEKLEDFDTGLINLDKKHYYAHDLDIFGSPSLYQYVNRATSLPGKSAVIDSLLKPLPGEEVKLRQEMLAELSMSLDFRENIHAHGQYFADRDKKSKIERSLKPLRAWLAAEERSKYDGILAILNFASPALMLVLSFTFSVYAYQIILVFIFLHFALLIGFVSKLNQLVKEVSQTLNQIKGYKTIIDFIHKESLHHIGLKELQQEFIVGEESASAVFSKLEKILQAFDARANLIYAIANAFLLLDIYWYRQAIRWKESYGHCVENWIEKVGFFEMLNSQAGYVFAHREHCWPKIDLENSYTFHSEGLGHPLIPEGQRVSNDFSVEGRGSLVLVTGSNMSGKSTFLRTVGLAAVMAQMGLPVCAKSLSISPMTVYSGMRTEDDLGESVSSFFAELKRIKGLLDLSDETRVLYLLDEILKGTNSDDRHKGSLGLIRQLMNKGTMGLVSTHDLALGKLETEHSQFKNFSFNSSLRDGELYFDYKISEGVCRSFNATILMERMGIIRKNTDQ